MNLKQGNLILIKWNDSNITHGWRDNSTIQFDDTAHCRHVGIFERETEDDITVAFGDSNCGSLSETITIPKGSIIEIKKLRIK